MSASRIGLRLCGSACGPSSLIASADTSSWSCSSVMSGRFARVQGVVMRGAGLGGLAAVDADLAERSRLVDPDQLHADHLEQREERDDEMAAGGEVVEGLGEPQGVGGGR